MFSLGDKIVHPMHGAGIINEIIKREVDGNTIDYYVLKSAVTNMIVLVPVHKSAQIGIRRVISKESALSLLEDFPELILSEQSNWNKRYKENLEKIRTGDITQLLQVIVSLSHLQNHKTLSSGEKKVLSSARQILISELSLVLDIDSDIIGSRVEVLIASH